jgi:predicted TIM-barrel fold metal-dependent hydrolase
VNDRQPGRLEIIDAHMHIDNIPALGWDMGVELCVNRMDEAGIAAAIVMTITDWPEVNEQSLDLIADACAAHPGRLYGFARIHPWYGQRALEALDGALTRGFKGLKLHPVTTVAHPASDGSVSLIRRAAERGAPTLFHCADEPMTTPLAIAAAARACPEATIILGHMGGYMHVDEAIEVAERFPNVVLETSAMPYPRKIRDAVDRLGAGRVLYASDGPGCSPRIEVEKVRLAQLGAEAESLVMGGNVHRILDRVR